MDLDLETKAQILKTLGHPVRLKIVALLAGKSAYVFDLMESLDIRQALLSQHLKVMKDHGLLKARREGVRVCYSLKEETLAEIVRLMQVDV